MSHDDDTSKADIKQNDAQRHMLEMAELAGGLAHELRNPLSTMMVNLKLLAEDLQDEHAHPDDTQRRALLKVEVLRREAERLQTLFDRFLSVAGPYELECVVIDLNAVVKHLMDFFAPSARDSGIELQLVLSSDEILCRLDSTLFRQALLNLLMNAQQAMPEGGLLRVTTAVENGLAAVSIADSGSGIADEDIDRILRPFYSTKAKGGGLGLSITKRVVEEHGGSLTFQTERGVGTTFTIRLPRAVDADH